MAAEMATFSVFVMGLSMSMWVEQSSGKPPVGACEAMFVRIVAPGVIHTRAIVDVVRVAKVKNMAYQSNGYAPLGGWLCQRPPIYAGSRLPLA